MRHRYLICQTLLIIAVALPTTASAQEAVAAPRKELSDTTRASCLIKIVCDPGTFPLTEETVTALLNSSPVCRSAAEEVFGQTEPPDVIFAALGAAMNAKAEPPHLPGRGGGFTTGRYFGAPGQPGAAVAQSPNTMLGKVSVAAEAGAVEYLEAVCKHFERALVTLSESERDQVIRQMSDAHEGVAEASMHFQELQEKRRAYCDQAGRPDLSREVILVELRDLEQEKLRIEMERVSRRARQEAIEQRIAKMKEAPDRHTDAAKAALEAAKTRLDALRDKHKRMQELAAKGRVPADEVMELEAQIMQGQAEIVLRQYELEAAASGGERVAEYNQALADQSVEEAETAARLHWLEERTARGRDALKLADEYERRIEMELPLAREAFEQSRMLVAELERRLRLTQPPSVTVLGAE